MTTKKRKTPKPAPVNKVPEPINTCSPYAAIERPKDSEAVALTKQCEDLTRQIESHRNILGSLRNEALDYERRISAALLNHASLRGKLNNAVNVPIPLG